MDTLQHPLSSVGGYVDYFAAKPLPVLRRTVNTLSRLASDVEKATRHDIATAVVSDPLMTMHLLSFLENHRKSSQNHDIVTIRSALLMMGILPFFRAFSNLPTVEEMLAAHPQALLGLLKIVGRSCRAAHYARDWAALRRDLDADEITIATLLREAAEMICWIRAPSLTQQVYELQRADSNLRSVAAQRAVFGVTAQEIQIGLVRAWNMPELLVRLFDATEADQPQIRNIILASDFARHLALGWNNPAIADDISAIARLLRLQPEALMRRLEAPEELWPRLIPAACSGTAQFS